MVKGRNSPGDLGFSLLRNKKECFAFSASYSITWEENSGRRRLHGK